MLVAKLDFRFSALKKYAERIKNAKYKTEIGIFEESTYSDDTSVAYVGYLNEFGGHNPPRPFLKRTAEKNYERWSKVFASAIMHDVNPSTIQTAHNRVGTVAVGDVQKTIRNWSPNDPRPNNPKTIAAKARKSAGAKGKNQVGNDPNRVLHDTGVMINSIAYKVEHT